MSGKSPDFFIDRFVTKSILSDLGTLPSKKLGQNFLVSRPTLLRVVESCELKAGEKIMEIGPGLGSLTFSIASIVNHIDCIEINPAFKAFLDHRASEFNLRNINVIQGDALLIDFPRDIDKVISAMPYSISGPLTSKIARYMERNPVPVYLICQREFSTKLLAQPGTMDYSRLSVNVSFIASTKKLMDISRNNFYPVPRVDSTLVKLSPIRRKNTCDFQAYRNLTRQIFPLKNKTLRHALKIVAKHSDQGEKLKACLDEVPAAGRRVRELAPEDIIDLVLLLKASGVIVS
ncbi:MAG: 16S rRNA (adenine(1518)-N(6)/adenine(1519)-N(6))-dimethyltransferase RsmA [Promethearchaeota archaeon]